VNVYDMLKRVGVSKRETDTVHTMVEIERGWTHHLQQ